MCFFKMRVKYVRQQKKLRNQLGTQAGTQKSARDTGPLSQANT